MPNADPEHVPDETERYLDLAERENKRLREREKVLEHALRVAARVLLPYAKEARR
jgi:hypothetical protein